MVLAFIPLVRDAARWTALGAGIAGIIWAVWALLGLTTVPREALFAPVVQLVFAVLLAYFSFAAYRERLLA